MHIIEYQKRSIENLQESVARLVPAMVAERGRGFASDYEAWAEIKELIERAKDAQKSIEKLHTEMWAAVKEHNYDAFAALSQELERKTVMLAGEWAQASALAALAVIGESED